jgi:hypothetical protein
MHTAQGFQLSDKEAFDTLFTVLDKALVGEALKDAVFVEIAFFIRRSRP